MRKFKVYVIETTVRPVFVMAQTPSEAQRIAEENYLQGDVAEVTFEVETAYNKKYEGDFEL